MTARISRDPATEPCMHWSDAWVVTHVTVTMHWRQLVLTAGPQNLPEEDQTHILHLADSIGQGAEDCKRLHDMAKR